jgi:hypothetical protein
MNNIKLDKLNSTKNFSVPYSLRFQSTSGDRLSFLQAELSRRRVLQIIFDTRNQSQLMFQDNLQQMQG